jgi:hypothetical protein
MAKKNNAIYAPGELQKVREQLGVTDAAEARRMVKVLGGEVGTERNADVEASKVKKQIKRDDVYRRRSRSVDVASDDPEEGIAKKSKRDEPYPGDDPSVPPKLSYFERVKIDKLSGQMVFEIKNSLQVLTSVFSFLKEPMDYVNPRFVTKRMNEYYQSIERMVTSVRNMFPHSNKKRANQLRRVSPFVYRVMEVLRSWDIETIARNIAELQSHPRYVRVSDFTEILRAIYKPLYILDDLNIENIKAVFKLIYKILYIESPMEAKEKYQEIIRKIITSFVNVRRDVQYGMYPLLMKLISDRFLPYERFFTERRRRFIAFLNVGETEPLNAAELNPQQIESMDVEAIQENMKESEDEEFDDEEQIDEDSEDPKVIAQKAKEEKEKAEQKIFERGTGALEALFPKAGWNKLDEYPDMYPYFSGIFPIKRGYELISPTDPLQQIAIIMHIIEDLFYGMRYVRFGTIAMQDGSLLNISEDLGEIVINWRRYIEESFSREYLPRLTEYCRLLDNSEEARISMYARKIINELQWIKRLYFLPYYKFDSIGPPPFHKQDVISIYSQVRKLRQFLTAVAAGVEQGNRLGGAAVKAPCDGIINPWESYKFEVPNPVSRRLDMLLPPEKRINATLLFFSLSTIAVLDHLVNNENCWSYTNSSGRIFRSVKDEGIRPLFGVDQTVDVDKIFRDSLKKE